MYGSCQVALSDASQFASSSEQARTLVFCRLMGQAPELRLNLTTTTAIGTSPCAGSETQRQHARSLRRGRSARSTHLLVECAGLLLYPAPLLLWKLFAVAVPKHTEEPPVMAWKIHLEKRVRAGDLGGSAQQHKAEAAQMTFCLPASTPHRYRGTILDLSCQVWHTKSVDQPLCRQ